MRALKGFLIIIFVFFTSYAFAGYDKLTKKEYEKFKSEKAVVLYGVNWGRQWGCAGLDNAQLQNLTFSRIDSMSKDFDAERIVLNIPSKLLAENVFKFYAIIVSPGEYAISGFDVKIAKSSKKAGHLKAVSKDLFKDGKSIGGTFKVNAGEIVYIGNFGLDCAYEPILWRYYIQEEDFENYVAQFKKKYRFIDDEKVIYRLFQTDRFGQIISK